MHSQGFAVAYLEHGRNPFFVQIDRVVELLEVAFKQTPSQRVVRLTMQHADTSIGGFAHLTRRGLFWWHKHHHATLAQLPLCLALQTFAGGAAGGVGKGAARMKGVLATNVLDSLGMISSSFGEWQGVAGGEGVEKMD